jgi:hypothetical protein
MHGLTGKEASRMLDGTGLETRQKQAPSATVKGSFGANAAYYSADNGVLSLGAEA